MNKRPVSPDPELRSVHAAVTGDVDAGPNESARRAAAARALIATGMEEQITSLRWPDARVRLFELVMFAAMWAVGGLVVLAGLRESGALHWALRLGGTLMIALALHSLALLMHDGVHHTLFRNRTLNRAAAAMLGSCVLISAAAYQAMHERHHIFLGDSRDPDEYHNYSGDRRIVWLLHYMRLLFGSFLYLIIIPLLVARMAAPAEKRRVAGEYAFLALIYAGAWIAIPHDVLLHAWLIPILPAGLMFNVRSLAAHGITDPRDPFLASRSIDAAPVVAFFFRNENYHLEHHLFPEIPSYNLRRLHELVFPRMPRAATAPSYIAFLTQFIRQSFTGDETPIGVITRPAAGQEQSSGRTRHKRVRE